MLDYFKSTQFKLKVANLLYKSLRLVGIKDQQKVTRQGVLYDLDLREGIDLSVYLFGGFQKHVYQNKFTKLADDAVIFDVGANIGSICLPLANVLSKSTVYAFEPTNFAFQKLLKNLELNPHLKDRVFPVQTFVSEEHTENSTLQAFASWRIDGKEDGAEKIHSVHGGTQKTTTNRQIKIDEFVKENNISRLDYLKIDTDGHELYVLRGAKETLLKFKPTIVFEVMNYELASQGLTFGDLEDFLKPLNYKMIVSDSEKPITKENAEEVVPSKGGVDVVASPIT